MPADASPTPYTLITGASSGLGLLFARKEAAAGKACILCARSGDKMEALARELQAAHGVDVRVIAADLSREEGIDAVTALVRDQGLWVETLINNAGFGDYGEFHEIDPASLTECIRLNCEAMVMLTRSVLDGMLARGRGRILNVASIGGFVPTPYMAVYGATKAFQLSFTQALREEVRGCGIRVCVLCPGPVETGFQSRAGMSDTITKIPGVWLDPESVVKAGLRALDQDEAVVVPGIVHKLQTWSSRLAPRNVVNRLSERAMRGLGKR